MKINVAHLLPNSRVNGPGERFVVWVQGCPLRCPGCWNPDTWSFQRRDIWEIDDLVSHILATDRIEGVTFTGGEPFAQAKQLAEVARKVRLHGLSVVIFTGYKLEELIQSEQRDLIQLADLIVTGRFIESLWASGLGWRGSKNQRLYFLTERYSQCNYTVNPEVEIFIESNGQVLITGFPSCRDYREFLQA